MHAGYYGILVSRRSSGAHDTITPSNKYPPNRLFEYMKCRRNAQRFAGFQLKPSHGGTRSYRGHLRHQVFTNRLQMLLSMLTPPQHFV